MAQLKSFYDLVNELSMKTDTNLKNLKIPVKGPKGTSKRMRMKVSTYDAPGAGDIKKAVNSSTHSADKKPEKYIGTDGKTKIRMVSMDKEVLKKETLNNIPLGRFAQMSEIASAVVFLASEAASIITGTSLLVDGGWTAK